jgi:hypothetical protein
MIGFLAGHVGPLLRVCCTLQAAEAGQAPLLLFLPTLGHGGGRTLSQAIDQEGSGYDFLAHRFELAVAY